MGLIPNMFRVQPTDFSAQVNQGGYGRVWTEDCGTGNQDCLENLFVITGGGGAVDNVGQPIPKALIQAKLKKKEEVSFEGDWIQDNGRKYYASCDANPICQSWDDFKTDFHNPNALSGYKEAYGNQQNKLDGVLTNYGRLWFYGLVFAPPLAQDENTRMKIPAGDVLVGRWIPSSSGGQASFSESIHW